MKHLPFIWANLWRKPIRTVFTLLSVVIGFTLLGLVLGLEGNLERIALSAHADRIYTSARFGGKLMLAQMQQMAQMRYVASVGALGAVVGYYQRPGNRVAVLMQGPGMRQVFPDLPLTQQQWDTLAKTREGIYVSRLVALRFGLEVGSEFPVICPSVSRADGSNLWTFRVLGIVPDMPLMPVGFATGSYDYLDQARPAGDRGEVQQFWVLAKDAAHTEDVTAEIDGLFSSSTLPTRSVSEKVMLTSNGGGGSEALVALISLALAGMIMVMFLTANALRHSIRERNTELALLKALGFSSFEIMTLVLSEAALPCLFGCLFGLAFAAGLAAVAPLILPAAIVIPMPKIDFGVISAAVGAALIVALVAATLPVLRIARLDVAAALARQ